MSFIYFISFHDLGSYHHAKKQIKINGFKRERTK